MDSSAATQPRLAFIAITTLVTCIASLAACNDSPSGPGTQITFEAALESDVLDGVAEVVAGRTTFAASVEIENAPADAVYTWRIAEGTCAEPGDRIGAANRYPDLEVEDGAAAATATVTAALDEEEDYIAAVYDETGDQPVLVACGALTVQD